MAEDSATVEKVGPGKPPLKYRFQKGQSGNPSGRPKRYRSLNDLLRSRLATGDDVKLVDVVVKLALKGERWAVELVWDRIEGKPAQMIDIEQRVIEVAKREGIDPAEAVRQAQRILEEANGP